tara:strand:+ start:225 stop:1106 length:882 start_codon:yes stop_codon:yes gene_type:complete
MTPLPLSPSVGSLFAGIGGFDLGVERAGCRIEWQVEIDPWCRTVLAKHWPEVPRYEDVKEVGAHNLKPVDWIVGGFPCQDLSTAGKQEGLSGDRSGLWWQMRRIIGELRPEVVIVENVPNLVFLGIEHVLGSLAEIGYDAEWDIISAQDIGAPHLRKRVWIVAHSDSVRQLQPQRSKQDIGRRTGDCGEKSDLAHADSAGFGEQCGTEPMGEELRPAERRRSAGRWQFGRNDHWRIEPAVGRVANGVPAQVDRIKGLGNAVVPQIVEWIARRILTLQHDAIAEGEQVGEMATR